MKNLNWTARIVALGALIVFAGTDVLRAQATAAISGTVTDSSGAILPIAVVTARNAATGIVRSGTSDEQGRYVFPELALGEYEVEAAAPGFQTVLQKGIALAVGSNPIVDFSMPIGQSQQTVNVVAEVSQVETTSAAITNLVGQAEIRQLPLNGRNYTQLIALAPGVMSFPGNTNPLFGAQQSFAVSGSRNTGYLYLMDGTNTTGYFNRGPGSGALGTTLGVDSIDQFQTLTNTYSAQYGGNGAVINASTKSGTNTFHGSAYEFLRNSALESRSFFDGSNVPAYRQNQFGATFGGPVVKEKAFFFANYEGFRSSRTVNRVATVPTIEAHNFMMPNAQGVYVPVTQNSNPTTAAAVKGVLDLFPIATTPILRNGLATGTGFVTMPNKTLGNQNYFIGRADYNISDKTSLFLRYVIDRAERDLDSLLLAHPEKDQTRNHYVTLETRRIISPSMINMARVSFVRIAEFGAFPKITPALQFYPGDNRPNGQVSIAGGVSSLGPNGPPFYVIPNRFGAGDDVVWTHESHTVKAGASVERLRQNAWNPGGIFGQWNFANLTSFLQGVPLQVTGAPSNAQYPPLYGGKDWRELVMGFYVQDDWKATRKLTLNLGFRYAPTSNPTFARHKPMALLNAPYGNWVEVKNARAVNISLRNWEPRIGLAWDPFKDHKTSIRAGFGIFHEIVLANLTPMYQQPPYFRLTQTLAQGATFPVMFSNVPPGTGQIPTNGSLACTVCSYYGQTRTPTTYQYNFTIQREIVGSTIATISFVGSHSNFLMVGRDFNYVMPDVLPDGTQVFGKLVNGNIVANPRVNPAYNAFSLQNGQASSHYEALQTSLRRQFSVGMQTQISYTWSKTMDNSSSGIGGVGDGGFLNPLNLRSDYGLSALHRAHNLRVSGLYQLPFKSRHAALNQVLSGWQLSGVGVFISGAPFSASVGFASTGTGAYTPRPNVIAGCELYPKDQTLSNWFNTACYTPPAIGQFGNLGRNTLIGPQFFNIDSSLAKDFRAPAISDAFMVQFRAEFFNILNHPNFANPAASLYTQGTNGAFNPNTSVNQITSTTSDSRQVQFGLKVLF